MIESIKIRNFKSIRDLEIDLAPLTILIGPNGSGKTSILEAISLMKQGVGRDKKLSDSLTGDLVDFESKKSIFRQGIEKEILSLGLTTNVASNDLKSRLVNDLRSFARRRKEREKTTPVSVDLSEPDRYQKDTVQHIRRSLFMLWQLLTKVTTPRARLEYVRSIRGDEIFCEHNYRIDGILISYVFDKDKSRFYFLKEGGRARARVTLTPSGVTS